MTSFFRPGWNLAVSALAVTVDGIATSSELPRIIGYSGTPAVAPPNGSLILDTDGAPIFVSAGAMSTIPLNGGTFTGDVVIADSGTIGFGTAGTDIVLTADGTDVAITGTGSLLSSVRITTTDGVASGTAKVVGGRLSSSVADSSAIAQAVAGYSSFDVTASIPANTLKAGSILKIRAVVRVTVALNGGATATGKLRIGGTDVLTSGACTTGAANDRLVIDAILTARAAPGASVAVAGVATSSWSDTAAVITVSEPTGVPTFATNGALTVDVQISTSAAGDASGRLVLEQLYVEVV
jgi:hypothetical protein